MNKNFVKLGAVLIAVILCVGMFSASVFAVPSLPDDTQRVLNIYKYSPTGGGSAGDGTVDPGMPGDKLPLENVEFEIYLIPDGETLAAAPDSDAVTAYKIPANLHATIKTNAAGLATRSFGTGDEDGNYLIVEKPNPAVSAPVAPFYVSLPMTNPTLDGWLYNVTVYPKNDLPAGPTINKDVNTIDNKTATNDIGDIQTWILRSSIPADLHQVDTNDVDVYAKDYTIIDILNSALTYQGGLTVKLIDTDGNELTLDSSCYITTGTSDAGTAGGTVKVALTPAGMEYIMANLGDGEEIPELRVSYNTAINDTVVLDEELSDNATLNYTNSAGKEYDDATVANLPEVHTGGLVIDKIVKGNATSKLPGATFKIARAATPAEIADGTVTKEEIMIGSTPTQVVFLDFYSTDTLEDATTVQTVTTDSDGAAIINGLAYGTYYLVETAAPAGYNLLSGPVTVEIEAADTPVQVANSAKFTLPVTGGTGTILFTLGGVVLIGVAGTLLLFSKKKNKAEK